MSDERTLTVYWCPRCNVQSECLFHFCEKGSPPFPQTDVETQCERITVVPEARLASLTEALRGIAALDSISASDHGLVAWRIARAALADLSAPEDGEQQ